jgi:hypothetical protein
MFRSRDFLIQYYAEETVCHLMQIPATSNYLNFQSLPLLAAGSELTGSRNLLRDQVRERLRAVYSLNRLPTSIFIVSFVVTSEFPETNEVRERVLINVHVRARPQKEAACLRRNANTTRVPNSPTIFPF